MTTLGQTLANRENALLSTGPKTEEGKARSAQNSLAHGFYATGANGVLTKGEDRGAFEAFAAGYLQELDPQTVAQMELAERIVGLVWKSRRAEALETALWNSGGGSIEDMAVMLETHGPQVDRAMRYARQVERQLAAARAAYRELQAETVRRAEALVRRAAEVELQAAEAAAEAAQERRRKEEDTWAETMARMEADYRDSKARESARKEGQSPAEQEAAGTRAWERAYSEENLKARKLLGRTVGKLMAESYYEEEAENEGKEGMKAEA